MIRGIIFDCFGVLYGGSLGALARAAGDRAQEISDIHLAKDYGYIDYEEFLWQISEVIGTSVDEVRGIIQQRQVLNTDLLDYTQRLRKDYKVGLLSNIDMDTAEGLFNGDIATYFDGVVLSSQEGMAKPSPEIYELAASRLGCKPEACIMIDDLEVNCDGAREVGMQAILYTSNENTMRRISEMTGGSHTE